MDWFRSRQYRRPHNAQAAHWLHANRPLAQLDETEMARHCGRGRTVSDLARSEHASSGARVVASGAGGRSPGQRIGGDCRAARPAVFRQGIRASRSEGVGHREVAHRRPGGGDPVQRRKFRAQRASAAAHGRRPGRSTAAAAQGAGLNSSGSPATRAATLLSTNKASFQAAA